MKNKQPLCVHLVGSLPLPDAEASFRTVSAAIGPYIKRLPDGEIGARRRWVGMFSEILERHPSFERDPDQPAFMVKFAASDIRRELPRFRIRPGIDPQAIRVESGYAAMAIDSFVIFDCLQREGVIPSQVRFQISLPSPLAPAWNYIGTSSRAAFLQLITDHLREEVQQIAAALPQERIAIQWDLLQELMLLEGLFPDAPKDCEPQISKLLGAIGEAVPEPIELGFHLCFGGSDHESVLQPRDATVLVRLMRETIKHVRRPIQYFHFPVPHIDDEASFYAPFSALALPRTTEMYAGLIHSGDDEGNRKRLERARRHLPVAGVAAACGWGRHDPAMMAELLQLARNLAA